MGQLQAFGPVRRSRGGPGFGAAFAPGTERNLQLSAMLGAVSRQFLGADSPIGTFAQESAQGGLQGFAEQRAFQSQLEQLIALGVLPAPGQQQQFGASIQPAVGGSQPGAQLPAGAFTGSAPTGSPLVPSGGTFSQFNNQSAAAPLGGRRFAGFGANFPGGGSSPATLGLSPRLVSEASQVAGQQLGTAVRAQSVKERTKVLKEESAAGRISREGIAERKEAGLEERFAGEREALKQKFELDLEGTRLKIEREEEKFNFDQAQAFGKSIQEAQADPVFGAQRLQALKERLSLNLRLQGAGPGLMAEVDSALQSLGVDPGGGVGMVGPDGRIIKVSEQEAQRLKEQGFRVITDEVAAPSAADLPALPTREPVPERVLAPPKPSALSSGERISRLSAIGDFRRALRPFRNSKLSSKDLLLAAKEFAASIGLSGDSTLKDVMSFGNVQGDTPEFVIVDLAGNIVADTVRGFSINELLEADQSLQGQNQSLAGVKKTGKGLLQQGGERVLIGSF